MKTITNELIVKLSIDSVQFEKDLARLTKKIGRVSGVPEWCYIPWMRYLVTASALFGPLYVVMDALR